MARNGATPKMDDLNLSDDDTEALFASPSRQARPKPTKIPTQQTTDKQSRRTEAEEGNDEEARDSALRKELAGIKNINQVIESATEGLERAAGNVDVCPRMSLIRSLTKYKRKSDCLQHCTRCFRAPQYLDTNPLADRTQPTPDPRSILGRSQPRRC